MNFYGYILRLLLFLCHLTTHTHSHILIYDDLLLSTPLPSPSAASLSFIIICSLINQDQLVHAPRRRGQVWGRVALCKWILQGAQWHLPRRSVSPQANRQAKARQDRFPIVAHTHPISTRSRLVADHAGNWGCRSRSGRFVHSTINIIKWASTSKCDAFSRVVKTSIVSISHFDLVIELSIFFFWYFLSVSFLYFCFFGAKLTFLSIINYQFVIIE